jgi:hypothetical protein
MRNGVDIPSDNLSDCNAAVSKNEKLETMKYEFLSVAHHPYEISLKSLMRFCFCIDRAALCQVGLLRLR